VDVTFTVFRYNVTNVSFVLMLFLLEQSARQAEQSIANRFCQWAYYCFWADYDFRRRHMPTMQVLFLNFILSCNFITNIYFYLF
jgi:hypothetical protein